MRNISPTVHKTHAWLIWLLIFTGMLLYSPFLRGILSETRIYIRGAHIFLGIAFTATMLNYLRLLLNNWQRILRYESRAFLIGLYVLLSLAAIATGFLLLAKLDLQSVIGYAALDFHKANGAVFFSAVLYHSLYYLFESKLGTGNSSDESPWTSRRRFMRWGVALTALLGGGFAARWVTNKSAGSLEESGNSPFRNCNEMTPQPTPSLGSVPPIGGGYKGEFEIFKVTSRIPCANSQTWQFRLFGLIDNPLILNWTDFLQIPRKVQVSNFHCITGWNVYDVTYEGILLSQLLALAKVKPDARYVKMYSADGVYTSALSLEQAHLPDVMVVVLMDGKPIPSDLGGPARLIVPQMYAYKGVKWLNAVELIQEPHLGFWEERGYVNDAWVRQPVK